MSQGLGVKNWIRKSGILGLSFIHELFKGHPVFRTGNRKEVQPGKVSAQEKGYGPIGLYFHKKAVFIQEQGACRAVGYIQVRSPKADPGVKGDPQVGMFPASEGKTLIGDKALGKGFIVGKKPANLITHLRRGIPMEIKYPRGKFRGDPLFIGNALQFLLQFPINRIPWLGNTVTAEPQFFFIGGFIPGFPCNGKTWGIIIEGINGIYAVVIDSGVILEHLQNRIILHGVKEVFLLIPLKIRGQPGMGFHRVLL
jgi:hypothetical protein